MNRREFMMAAATAAMGGSVGALAAMRLFHHKTLHLKFKYGVPLIMALQIGGLVYLHLPK